MVVTIFTPSRHFAGELDLINPRTNDDYMIRSIIERGYTEIIYISGHMCDSPHCRAHAMDSYTADFAFLQPGIPDIAIVLFNAPDGLMPLKGIFTCDDDGSFSLDALEG